MKKTVFFVLFFLASFVSHPIQAATHIIDLSKAANRGFEESFDNAAGVEDLQKKQGLTSLPVGPQTFRGIPFQILDPSKNQGRSFVVLKGRHKPDFPEGVSISANGVRAPYLYFLHTCRWGGTAQNVTVAEYDIVYDDGQVLVIPLRVGMEFSNFFSADDTSSSFLAWWYKYKNAEMGISLYPWKNPRPDKLIQSILFKSHNNMPVPILFAITSSDKELPISTESPKPEKIFQTDTSKWIPFVPSGITLAGTAIDMSFLLDAPAGKHGKVKADGDKLVFEDGTPARFWGTRLENDLQTLSKDQMEKLAVRLASYGCNVAVLKGPSLKGQADPSNLKVCLETLKAKGIYATFAGDEKLLDQSLLNDPAVIPQNLGTLGVIYRNDSSQFKTTPLDFTDLPMVMYPEESIPFHLGFQRSFGLPYRAEWRNGWPNEYLSETPLLVAAYGCFSDWTACIGMGLDAEGGTTVVGPDLDISSKPVLSVQWPVAALVYLRGDLKVGKLNILEPRDELPDIATSLKALAHRSGLSGTIKTDVSGELKAKVRPKLKTFISDSGQITWQGNVGVIQIFSPRFQALIGFLSHRKFNNTCWGVETPNSFASLSVISLTKGSISLSDHLLVTGVTRMENTSQVYNAAKTKLISPGKAPILVEPLSAKFVLYRPKADPKLKIRALDANGQPVKSKVPFKWVKNSLVFSWIPSAFYLEILQK